eukprot:scaffold76652_cov31-Tisochrysis_lutea.AAC.3
MFKPSSWPTLITRLLGGTQAPRQASTGFRCSSVQVSPDGRMPSSPRGAECKELIKRGRSITAARCWFRP